MSQWIFPEKDSKQKARNPITDEFFDSPELLTDVSSLVRESIQNSIDARLDAAQPVEVVVSLGSLASSKVPDYFDGLQPHLTSTFGVNAPQVNQACNYLVIEDFNTTGLAGDSTLDTAPAGKEAESSYTYFIHVEGESNKGAGKKGKWGVGKIVFQMLSGIKTFFVFTNRTIEDAPDGDTSLWIGQSILKFHKIGNKTFMPDGWFARDNEHGPYLPYKSQEAITLAEGWNVTRTTETGLSVVIPYISDNVQIEAIRDAIMREYFIPIIKGDLVCKLRGFDGSEIRLDQMGLLEYSRGITLTKNVANDRTAEEISSAIELVAASENLEVTEFNIELPDSLSTMANLDLEESQVTSIREAFEAGEKVKIRLKVSVPTGKTTGSQLDTYEVLFMKSEISKSSTFYAREGILVPGRPNPIASTISLALVDSGPLADLLGAAEGPAHESWSAGTDKFKATYGSSQKASKLIAMVRATADKIIQLISSQSGSFDLHILDEFFKLPEKDKPKIDPPITPPPPPKNALPVTVTPISGGFKISGPAKDSRRGKLLVAVAYEVSRGNAFRKYRTLDFVLKSEDFSVDNCKVLSSKDNQFVLEVGPNEFNISYSKLGTLRDIEIDVNFVPEVAKGGVNA